MSQLSITLKRVYLPPSPADGTRIFVERLWPRGLTKDKAAIDHWVKNIAPTPELRKWYGHAPDRWDEFRSRGYRYLESSLFTVLRSSCRSPRMSNSSGPLMCRRQERIQ